MMMYEWTKLLMLPIPFETLRYPKKCRVCFIGGHALADGRNKSFIDNSTKYRPHDVTDPTRSYPAHVASPTRDHRNPTLC
jgi:hypothetical protein